MILWQPCNLVGAMNCDAEPSILNFEHEPIHSKARNVFSRHFVQIELPYFFSTSPFSSNLF